MRDAPDLLRGVAFGAVEAERQTQDYASHVKLQAKFGERAEQTLPGGARQGRERAHGQAQLVRDGQADSLRTHVDGEDTTLHVRPSRLVILDEICAFGRRGV